MKTIAVVTAHHEVPRYLRGEKLSTQTEKDVYLQDFDPSFFVLKI
jgi:hypothetical protein